MVRGKLQGDDHVAIDHIRGDGSFDITVHREDGNSSSGILIPTSGGDGHKLEQCIESNLYHLSPTDTGHRGPAKANSRAFCEGWEKIQWKSRTARQGGHN